MFNSTKNVCNFFAHYTERRTSVADSQFPPNPINIRVCESPQIRGNGNSLAPVRVSRGQKRSLLTPNPEPLTGVGGPSFDPQKSPKNSQKIFLKDFRKNPQNWLRKHFSLKSFRNMSIHQTRIVKVQTKPR